MSAASSPAPGSHWPTLEHETTLGLMVPVSERHVFPGTPRFADVLNISQHAAGAGFEILWIADHFSFPDENGLRGAWDAWTLMAALAASVPDVHIGPMVACSAYRNPGVIAKMTEMIDEISGGRFILGLGAGWQEDEYKQFGIQFEPRVSQFEEALTIIHGLLREGEADLQGKYYQANQAKNLPRGPRPHGAPILIGSSGKRMLSLLARYADAWNTGWYGSTDGIAEKIAAVDAACEAAGRDPATVVKTVAISVAMDGYTGNRPNPIRGSVDDHLQFLNDLKGLGLRHICVGLDPCTPESIAAYQPVVDAFLSSQQ
jgi:alkanesulfonate monooxygenase SsuD/methylene tetrahydromethanopterin reductase-like flavin-dependent oxidoreductase (luciferase family)